MTLIKACSFLNINLVIQLYQYFFSKKPTCVFDVFDRWSVEAELSQSLSLEKKIEVRSSLPKVPFLKIGIVLDIWDLSADRWPLSALLQTAQHYKVTPKEALANYQIVVTPFGDYHGTIFARRVISPLVSV